jgi:hypothetical protein
MSMMPETTMADERPKATAIGAPVSRIKAKEPRIVQATMITPP